MALVRDIIFKRCPDRHNLILAEIAALNLKIINKLTIKFDPFRDDVKDIRDFNYYIYDKTARASNTKLLLKTEILSDRSEQTVTFDLANNQRFIFKCGNLKVLEIFKLINKYITPLSPVEEVAVTPLKTGKKKK